MFEIAPRLNLHLDICSQILVQDYINFNSYLNLNIIIIYFIRLGFWGFGGDGDDGGGYIWSGRGFVNRIGYFVTEVPCPPDTTIQIRVDIPFYYCENCDTEWEDIDNLIRDKFQEHDLEKCPNCATIEEIRMMEMK